MIPTRPLGTTGLRMTELSFGAAPLGELFTRLEEAEAQAVLKAAWDGGMRYFDTAPFYGHGKSEHRVGTFLRQQPREDFVISTKIGRLLVPTPDLATFDPGPWSGALLFDIVFDYSYEGIMRSWEDSLQRLGLNRIDLLVIHDLDTMFHTPEEVENHTRQLVVGGGIRALEELRESGRIAGFGVGVNYRETIHRVLAFVRPDFFLIAMPYTLLDQDVLDDEFPRCAELGISLVIGAVFASGILITGPTLDSKYGYESAPPEILEKTRRMVEICEKHGVRLSAAALQFLLAHPLVAAIIPGALAPEHVQHHLEQCEAVIPSAFWSDLKARGLLHPGAPVPVDESA
ncbi:MAG: D-threo-aldose 1-dehydrogenase [Verrucomicrobiales bacterium]|jgi:D-threo-aldose 1-dehydrogenase